MCPSANPCLRCRPLSNFRQASRHSRGPPAHLVAKLRIIGSHNGGDHEHALLKRKRKPRYASSPQAG